MRRLLMILAAVFLVASCAKDDPTYQKQLTSIQKFIESEEAGNKHLIVTRFGDIYRLTYPKVTTVPASSEGEEPTIIVEELTGEAVKENGLVQIKYTGHIFSGRLGTVFATNDITVATANRIDTSNEQDFEPLVLDLSDKTIVEGLRKGLAGVRPGEQCTILFPSRYGMGEKAYGMIPASSSLAYEVQVIDIEN